MNEAWLRLITGLVDGELSAAERARAEKILRQSDAARDLYRQLRAHQDRIKHLPDPVLPPDFKKTVLTKLRNQDAIRTARHARKPAGWPYVAAAASLLFVVSLAALLWMFNRDQHQAIVRGPAIPSRPHVGGERSTQQPPRSPDPAGQGELLAVGRGVAEGIGKAIQSTANGILEKSTLQAAWHMEQAATLLAEQRAFASSLVALSIASSRLGQGVVTQADKPASPLFRQLQFQLPPIIDGAGLTTALPSLNTLTAKGGFFQIDIATKDPHAVLESLVAAAESASVRVVVDADVRKAVRAREMATFSLYFENLPPAVFQRTLAAFATQANDDEKQVSMRSMIVAPIESESARRLAADLGVPPATLVSRSHGELTSPKDWPEDRVRPSPSAPQAGKGELPSGIGVVFLQLSNRNGKFATREIRDLLDRRAGPHEGRVSLLLTIRPVP